MERFGIPRDIIERYDFYEFAKGVWVTTASRIPEGKIETVGIRALRLSRDSKPTTAFLRVIGKHATKNVVVISSEEGYAFLKGEIIEGVCGEMHGYVVVRTEEDILGCGFCKESSLYSQVPKKYRPEDTWV